MLELDTWAKAHGVDIARCVDISGLTEKENRGLPRGVLLLCALPREYVKEIGQAERPDETIFAAREQAVQRVADALCADLAALGYQAISQADASLGARGEFDFATKTSPLPNKKIAIMAGAGWIGKNNLLITEPFGPALCMCTVLTDAPLPAAAPAVQAPRCGSCNACVKACPPQVLHNVTWRAEGCRDDIVDVYHCEVCLRCMAHCPYAVRYGRG